MFRFKIRAALVALTAIVVLAAPVSALATNVTDWGLVQENNPGASNSDLAPYAAVPTVLLNWNPTENYEPLPSALVYGYETFGLNLTYATPSYGSSSSDYQWEFIRQPGAYATQQVSASERVALYNTTNHGYLARACTDSGCIGEGSEAFGINLYWSTTPQYEWQVAKGGDNSFPNYADLYNTTEQAYLISWSQTFGVDLGWIHAPFETGPDYIPPNLPVSTPQPRTVASPLPVEGS